MKDIQKFSLLQEQEASLTSDNTENGLIEIEKYKRLIDANIKSIKEISRLEDKLDKTTRDLWRLEKAFEGLKLIVDAQDGYIKFLGDSIAKDAKFLHVHGHGASEETIREGLRLRDQILRLKAGLTERKEWE